MSNKQFEHNLESMSKPNLTLPHHEKKLRFAYVNAKKSAWWGIILIVLPVLFVAYNLTKHVIGLSFLPNVEVFFPTRAGDFILNNLLPLIFFGGGLIAIILNLLAVLHFEMVSERHAWTLHISIKRHKWNLVILAVTLATLFILSSYVLLENWQCIIGLAESC